MYEFTRSEFEVEIAALHAGKTAMEFSLAEYGVTDPALLASDQWIKVCLTWAKSYDGKIADLCNIPF